MYSKGFICSGGNGTLHLFEKTDEKCLFKRTRSVTIDADPSSQMDQAMLSNGATSNEIMCLTLSPSEENIVCTTRSQQLYNLTLSAADIERVGILYLRTITCMQSIDLFYCSIPVV